MERRLFLKKTVMASITTIMAFSSSLLWAKWDKETFDADSLGTAMKAIGADKAKESDKISIKVPDIAENGNIVPIEVTTKLKDVSQMHLLIAANVLPLAASFKLGKDAVPVIKSRFKVAKRSDLIAVVQADGKIYKTTVNVDVTIGGCGG